MNSEDEAEAGWATAKTLAEALPFIQRYDREIVVIKYGGHAMGEEEVARLFAADAVLLKLLGLHPVVVHGGGPQISRMLDKAGVKSEFIDGLRVTDAATMEVAEMVLSGAINKEIANWITLAGREADVRGVGLSGKDARLITVTKARRMKDGQPLALVDSFLPSAAGLYALRENYLYTVEAMGDYLNHLTPGGMVAISRWLKNPPRDSLKLTATAVAALRQQGVKRPGEHLVLIRGWQTTTLVVTREALGEGARGRLEDFCRQRLFDIVYAPGVEEGWANRYNVLAQPTLADGVRALLGSDGEAFITGYKFDIAPASDNRPYFHHFFKWSSLAEVLRLRASGGAALMESGYLILVAVFAVAVPAALLLIVAPLLLLPREAGDGVAAAGSRLRSAVYFFATGLAFMLIEIATIQKAMPILHHPVYAVSVVIAAFLLFAGIGSTLSAPLAARLRPEMLLRLAVAMIILCGSLVATLGAPAAALLPQLGLAARAGLTVLAIAPLALFMGMPFPLGLSRLPPGAAGPWAWGINGCASVLGSMTATLVAIHYGFNVVLALALMLYVLVAASFPVDAGDDRRQAAALSDPAAAPGPG